MERAVVDERTCLPHAGREAGQLCVDECDAAGNPIDGSGHLAPVVRADRCVGCRPCQARCHGISVAAKGLLPGSPIVVVAGPGTEDRLRTDSYVALRREESRRGPAADAGGVYLPEQAGSGLPDGVPGRSPRLAEFRNGVANRPRFPPSRRLPSDFPWYARRD